ncbi:MAG: site-specific integrase [Myxococcales bacterium]|nr:site-specific integrase [Myxococcales bacterium]
MQLTFRGFVDGAFARLFMPRYRPSTRERYHALMRQTVMGFFGEMKLAAIDAAALRGYAAMLSAKKVQVKGGVNLVRTVLRAALESGELERLPELPRLVKASRKLPDTFTDDELVIIASQAQGWLATAIQLSAQAGLRMGEVLALLVGDIDFDQENLLVKRALSGGEVLTPKSGDQRVVPLTPELSAYLHTQVDGRAHDAQVVLDEAGKTPRRQELLRVFKRLLRKLGLKERSFHSLRHSFLSRLVRRGASVEAVRMLAGHSSLTVTERYVHANAGDLRRAIGLLH